MEQGKVTLQHGPIETLDMPGMTMVFKVADPGLLDTLTQGDKVKFAAANVNGALTVTAIGLANACAVPIAATSEAQPPPLSAVPVHAQTSRLIRSDD